MNIEEELERINALDDLYQQGYQAGPLLYEVVADQHPEAGKRLILLVMIKSTRDVEHRSQRDRGLMQWCLDQQGSIEA